MDMVTVALRTLTASANARAQLSRYFGHVRRGQPIEYRTPFYSGRSLIEVCEGWQSTLEPGLRTEYPQLLAFENDLLAKVGPLSIMKPLRDRLPDIYAYYDGVKGDARPISEAALNATVEEWATHSLRLRSQAETVLKMKKSTSSGLPFMTKRREVVDKSFPTLNFMQMSYAYTKIPVGLMRTAAILGWRGQEGGLEPDDVKQRVVWMFPFSVNIQELQCYQPLIEYAQKSSIVPAWVSMRAVDERITRLFDSKDPKDPILCTDFTKFDQHFGRRMQDGASYILSHLFADDPEFSHWLDTVYPIKFEIPMLYNVNTKSGVAQLILGQHGMGSGSGGTNGDETVSHRALQHEAAISAGKVLNQNSQDLGDDGVICYPGIDIDHVLNMYTSHGLEMNATKQYISTDDCIYLRRWHGANYRINDVCVGVYSTYRALGRLCEQERYYTSWSAEMVALRQLSILQNLEFHPMRFEFADYCMKGDKYRLGIDLPGFMDNLERIKDEATDLIPNFIGYVNSEMSENRGINEWWIVKYLRSKA